MSREPESQHDGVTVQISHRGTGDEGGDLLALPPYRRDDLRPDFANRCDIELPGNRRAIAAEHERAVLQAGGVLIRYGQLYGPGTYFETDPPEPPRIHVDDAALQTLPALGTPPGVTIVADDRAGLSGSPLS